MKEELDDIFQDDEDNELVVRYEEMLKNNQSYFFDVVEFENIIDYYIDTNKANNALKAVKFAAQQHPQSINIELKKAQVLIDKGHPDQALNILERIERIEASNTDVFLLKGSTLNVMGRYNEAERSFDSAIDNSYEEKVDIIHTIAQSFEQIGRYKTALKYLHEAFSLDSKNGMLLYDIGYCYEKMGQIDKSISFYNQYLEKEPFSDNAWYNLGILYNKAEKYDEAIDAYEFAIAITPEFSVAYFNLANTYSNKEDYLNAIINYKEYLNFDGNSGEILTYIGDSYESLKEYDLAIKYYDKALENDDYFADAYYGKANVMYDMGKAELALSFVEKAIVINDINAEYYFLLGNIYTELNLNKEALDALKKAYGIDPEEIDFLLALSDAYFNNNKVDTAIHLLQEFTNDNAGNALVYYRLAACFFVKNNKKKALEEFENGLKINPKSYMEVILYFPDAVEDDDVNTLLDRYYFNKTK